MLTYDKMQDIAPLANGSRPLLEKMKRLIDLFPNYKTLSQFSTRYIVTNLRENRDGKLDITDFLKHDWSNGYFYIFEVTDNITTFRKLKELENDEKKVEYIDLILDAIDPERIQILDVLLNREYQNKGGPHRQSLYMPFNEKIFRLKIERSKGQKMGTKGLYETEVEAK